MVSKERQNTEVIDSHGSPLHSFNHALTPNCLLFAMMMGIGG